MQTVKKKKSEFLLTLLSVIMLGAIIAYLIFNDFKL